MSVEIITKEDLRAFRIDLLNDIKTLLGANEEKKNANWMKGNAVREVLGISAGTLQSLRISGKLPYSKLGGTYFYSSEDLQKYMDRNKVVR